jgi:hypothetical protein
MKKEKLVKSLLDILAICCVFTGTFLDASGSCPPLFSCGGDILRGGGNDL